MVAPDQVLAVHRALAAAKVPHAIGGAVALGLYGAPRETVDIDVNVIARVEGRSELRFDWAGTPIHLFFDEDELHAAMPPAVREVEFAAVTIPIVAPEHLVIRKAMLDRRKDWLDIEAMLVATEPLDLAEINAWLVRLAGVDDPRVTRMQQLAARLLS